MLAEVGRAQQGCEAGVEVDGLALGVLPEAASAFPLNPFQIWVPRPAEVSFLVPSQLNNGGFFFQAVARLRPGVSLEQAQDAMNVLAAGYRAANPSNVDAPTRIELVRLLEDAVGQQRQGYLLLFGAVGCVLLIACANIANLLLARLAGRRKEIAARFALGATRVDVVRQMVTETMLVALLGGAGALARFFLDGAVSERTGGGFPYGTLAVNLSGTLLLGLLAGLALHGDGLLLAGTAVLGSYTTFSTWMLESHRLGEDGRPWLLWANLLGSLAAGIGALVLGRVIGGAL